MVMIVNACIVIALQYLLSRGMRQENMLRWLALGTLFFIVGLIGFMLAGQSVWLWAVAMAIFTLGRLSLSRWNICLSTLSHLRI